MSSDAFVYDAVRTPFGKFNGGLAGVRPDDLAATVVKAVLDRNPGLDPGAVEGSSSATPTERARTTATSPGWPACWRGCR